MRLPWLLLTALLLVGAACSPIQPPVSASTQPSQSNGIGATSEETATAFSFTPPVKVPSALTEPVDHSTNVPASATAPIVTITAVNGNLSIRKGPDITFDAFAILPTGESASAIARSILDGWLEVEIASHPATTGWIFIKSSYALVSGNILSLSVIRTVEWPFGSYLRNCTKHQLIVEPGEKVLPVAIGTPEDYVWFTPGLYMVYDLGMAGHPWIRNIKLAQHISIDIRKDGTGETSICLQSTGR